MNPQLAAETGRAALSIAVRWQEELMRFSLLRMNRYCDLSQRLRQCRSLGDVLASQSDFVQQMLVDYGTESQLLTKDLVQPMAESARAQAAGPVPSYEKMILEAQHDAARIIEMAKEQAERIVAEAHTRVSRKNGSSRHPRRAAGA
jgi:cell division septum initiation protein DivIVA